MDFYRMIAFQFWPLTRLSKLLMGLKILAKMHPFQVKYSPVLSTCKIENDTALQFIHVVSKLHHS